MSDPTGYDIIDNDTYELGRSMMKERVFNHWMSFNWNRWTTYNTELNDTWTDPWFESDLHGLPAPDGDPDHQMLQNLYGLYCWFSYKEYGKYAMTGLLTSSIQESTMTGGMWEGGWHPYSSTAPGGWVNWDATSLASGYSSTTHWYTRNGWHDSSGRIAEHTAKAWDSYLGEWKYLTATAGSGIAVRKFKILMESWPDPDDPEVVWSRPVYPLTWNYNEQDFSNTAQPPYPLGAHGGGYGLAQFTPWTDLVRAAALAAEDGNKHWQCNLTLQLMSLPYLWDDLGKWNPNGYNSQDPPGFVNPVTGQFVQFLGMPITWEEWAADSWLPTLNMWLTLNGVTGENADWCRRQLAMSIYRVCFIGTTYQDFNFQQKSLWIISAINYWEDNGGWDPMDIPRPRDIATFELDYMHIMPLFMMSTQQMIIANKKKRRPPIYVKRRSTLPF